jgi:hypothetical protein
MATYEIKNTDTIMLTLSYRELEVLEMRLNQQPGKVTGHLHQTATDALFARNAMANGWNPKELDNDGDEGSANEI